MLLLLCKYVCTYILHAITINSHKCLICFCWVMLLYFILHSSFYYHLAVCMSVIQYLRNVPLYAKFSLSLVMVFPYYLVFHTQIFVSINTFRIQSQNKKKFKYIWGPIFYVETLLEILILRNWILNLFFLKMYI